MAPSRLEFLLHRTEFRHIATRYEKTDTCLTAAMIKIAAVALWVDEGKKILFNVIKCMA
jgi:hypothetical protein